MDLSGDFSIACPTEVRFGLGRSQELGDLLEPFNGHIALVHGASGHAVLPVLRELRRRSIQFEVIKVAGEPSVNTVNDALIRLGSKHPRAVVGCGGGSAIDVAKAIKGLAAVTRKLPDDLSAFDQCALAARSEIYCVALPTTAGTGAEVTKNAVLDVPLKQMKLSLRGIALAPDVAIVDPKLMRSSPAHVAIRSGLDAVTQVIEVYLSNAATPFTDGLVKPAIEDGLRALKTVVEDNDLFSWSRLAWTSLASGLALSNGGLGAVHGLAAVVGGIAQIPHGALCGRLLSPTLRQNLARTNPGSEANKRVKEVVDIIAAVFPPKSEQDALSGFDTWLLYRSVPKLSDWSIKVSDFDAAASAAVHASSSQRNPVRFEKEDFLKVLENAL